jgi:hypothetical protein
VCLALDFPTDAQVRLYLGWAGRAAQNQGYDRADRVLDLEQVDQERFNMFPDTPADTQLDGKETAVHTNVSYAFLRGSPARPIAESCVVLLRDLGQAVDDAAIAAFVEDALTYVR